MSVWHTVHAETSLFLLTPYIHRSTVSMPKRTKESRVGGLGLLSFVYHFVWFGVVCIVLFISIYVVLVGLELAI